MVITQESQRKFTLSDFLSLPETKPAKEYIEEEIIQKPMPQGEHSVLQIRLGTAINEIALPQKLAYAFPELRCTFAKISIVPDLAIFTWDRIPRTTKGKIANKFTLHPDWIIEILSPEQSTNKVIKKILFCLQNGTELGWLIDPKDESVIIFKPNQLPEMVSDAQPLPTLTILKDWQLSTQEMFAWLTL